MTKPHIDQGFDAELNRLRVLTSRMAGQAERMLAESLEAWETGDREQARRVVSSDPAINALEVLIDERCLKLLARWQPVAGDLRYVAATLKLVTDLERIGDHCVNICECVLQSEPPSPLPRNVITLGTDVQRLLRDALEGLQISDLRKSDQVLQGSKQIDARVSQALEECFRSLRDGGLDVRSAIRTHELAGYLHRIAAHATNIAEMVVFLVRGEDIRHPGKLPLATNGAEAGGPGAVSERDRPR